MNVTELFDAITEKLLSLEPVMEEKIEQISLNENNQQNSSGGCC